MKKSQWKKKIVEATKNVGTYQESFIPIIETLSEILERRDEADDLYVKSGGQAIIKYTNKGGSTNPSKNPCLVLWDELNKSALAYWRDLGLTPAGLKKINEDALKPKKKSALAQALAELGEEL